MSHDAFINLFGFPITTVNSGDIFLVTIVDIVIMWLGKSNPHHLTHMLIYAIRCHQRVKSVRIASSCSRDVLGTL